MLRRLFQLYRDDGIQGVWSGVGRFLRVHKRDAFIWALRRSSKPKETFRSYLRFRSKLQPSKYTDADPFKILYVDPDQINFHAYNAPTAWGRVSGGSWKRIPFEEVTACGTSVHRSNILHFVEGVPWEETPIYEARMQKLGNNKRGFSTREEVICFLEELDNLYEKIDTKGYFSQKELLREYPNKTTIKNNDEIHPTLNEIGVNIDQNGEFLWSRCGVHRLSIAKILDISEVPIQIHTRHKQWQNIRDKIRQSSSTNELPTGVIKQFDQPDLEDLM